ncbi:MAG: 5-hydroxyisourate hydrolase [Polyangiaceae bacterium]|jgi:5-hydroxyisourate hydrolase|nr:5-hydroxyisourate hydrolase [Polyangiaceae bacterium]
MTVITTHVLDTSLGKPAASVPVVLSVREGAGYRELARGVTDADGRVRRFEPEPLLGVGAYSLTFETSDYFRADSRAAFFQRVTLEFFVADESQHYHVPLLLSPFGYTTYRGS